MRRPNVAVLGAGFGGLWAARTLAKGAVDVTLIDKHNYHTFFPLLYQVGAAELEPEDIAQPLRKIFWQRPNVHFHLGEVQHIDLDTHVVTIPGHELRYDYLVIGLGSRPNFYGIPGAAEYAFTLKSLAQGMVLRNQILACFERAACEPDPGRRRAWLSLAIVGGGPTGVEFAGALMELIHGSLARDFPDLDLRQVRVTLLEAADHLLDNLPDGLSGYARLRLQRLGVAVRLGAQVVRVTPDEVRLKDGARIAARTVIWTAGVLGSVPGDQWDWRPTVTVRSRCCPPSRCPVILRSTSLETWLTSNRTDGPCLWSPRKASRLAPRPGATFSGNWPASSHSHSAITTRERSTSSGATRR